MDRRTAVALALTALVLLAPAVLLPRRSTSPAVPARADSGRAGLPNAAASPSGTASLGTTRSRDSAIAPSTPPVRLDSTTVHRKGADQTYLLQYAAPSRVILTEYKDLRPKAAGRVELAQRSVPLLRYRLIIGHDTVAVDQLAMAARGSDDRSVGFASTPPMFDVRYEPDDRDYVTRVRGSVASGVTGLLIDLPGALESHEADTLDDRRHGAYTYRLATGSIESIPFTKLDTARLRTDLGPMRWVAARNKYFLLALVSTDSLQPFDWVSMRGGPRLSGGSATGVATTEMRIRGGTFSFSLYAGPQSWSRLHAVGSELENVNPYAGWAHSVAQPFVTIVMRVLLWLRATLGLNYGWVLVIFGVGLRVIMWPLNQTAMRSNLKLQRLQPELQVLQKRYANDQEAQRAAIMKLYQDHGMNPLSPLMGCLPMLLPMPVLFALYFVFQNTIEFRGVPFLWLPDLSLRDPFYITPILMGASMLVLSWIGMRNAPPNPQAKLMGYMMPAMMTFMFLNFASGLNLYYGVQNLVAIPQQWLLTRQRTKAMR